MSARVSEAREPGARGHAAGGGHSPGYWRIVWRQLRRKPLAMAGLATVALLAVVAVGAGFLASDLPLWLRFHGRTYAFPNVARPAALLEYDNQRLMKEFGDDDWAIFPPVPFGPTQHPEMRKPPPAPPDGVHWLGTDDRGRDVLARMIHGTRVSLSVGFVAVAIYVAIGMALGAVAGYYGGVTDAAISRAVEIMLTFPALFLILAIMGMLEKTSIFTVMLVLGLTGWSGVTRLVRGEVLKIRGQDFVVAARAQGIGDARIVLGHVLPNALGPVLVSATFGVAGAILVEAALSFLGFGTPPPTASWGEILNQAQQNDMRWWLTIFPGAAIFVTVTAYNLLGEGLRDAIDPRLRQA